MNSHSTPKTNIKEEPFSLGFSVGGLLLGPFYLFMGGAYLPAFLTLLVYYILRLTIPGEIATLLVSLFCALVGNYFFDKYSNRKHIKLRKKLLAEGCTENEINKELRRRERSFSFLNVIIVLGAIFLYWGVSIFLDKLVSVLSIKS